MHKPHKIWSFLIHFFSRYEKQWHTPGLKYLILYQDSRAKRQSPEKAKCQCVFYSTREIVS